MFIFLFTHIVKQALEGICDVIVLKYCFDRDLYNLTRLKLRHALLTLILDFLYADDAGFNTHLYSESQQIATAHTCTRWGLFISKEKTEVIHQPPGSAPQASYDKAPS